MEVSFVSFDRRFLEASYQWLQDEYLRKMIQALPVSKDDQEKWFLSLSQRNNYFIWGVQADGIPVGATGIKNVAERSGEYWGYIGDSKMRGKGLGKHMIKFAEEKAKELAIEYLTLSVLTENSQAIHLYLKSGFRIVDRKIDSGIIEMDKYLGISNI